MSNFQKLSGKLYTATFTPHDSHASSHNVITVSQNYADASGNAGTAKTSDAFAIDDARPILTITDDKDTSQTSDVLFTFTFSEAVIGFAAGDIIVTGGIKGAFTKTGAQTYTLSVSASSNDNITMMQVSVAADSYRDAAHNTGTDTGTDTGSNKTITGRNVSEILIGAAGNDEISGNGGADMLIGGTGNDRIIINQSNIEFLENGLSQDNLLARIDGGSDGWIAALPATDKAGDVLALDGNGLNLDLTKIKQNSIQDIEIIDLTGNGDNILTLNIHDVIDITNDNNIVRVSGESGDKVVSAGWRDTGTDKVVDGITYNVFKDSSDATLAELWVDQDIDVAGITADIL